MVVFLGIMSNIASSTGFVVWFPWARLCSWPLAAIPSRAWPLPSPVYPVGWSANLLIGTNDPMFAGMSTQAANMLDPNYVVSPLCNWFFMFASTFVVTAIGTFVTDKIVRSAWANTRAPIEGANSDLTAAEKRGLKFAGIAALIYIALILIAVVPTNGLLRSETGGFLQSPFMSGIIFIMMLLFLIPGIAFGVAPAPSITTRTLWILMTKGISGLSGFMVLIFFAASFTNFFTYSNLGDHPVCCRRQLPGEHRLRGPASDRCPGSCSRHHQPVHRGGQRQVGHHGSRVCAHVHASGHVS